MKAGTTTGANICHLALAVGTNKFARPIMIIVNIIKGRPVKPILPIALAHQEAITVPIFVSLNTDVKNNALLEIAKKIEENKDKIFEANKKDLEYAQKLLDENKISKSMFSI